MQVTEHKTVFTPIDVELSNPNEMLVMNLFLGHAAKRDYPNAHSWVELYPDELRRMWAQSLDYRLHKLKTDRVVFRLENLNQLIQFLEMVRWARGHALDDPDFAPINGTIMQQMQNKLKDLLAKYQGGEINNG